MYLFFFSLIYFYMFGPFAYTNVRVPCACSAHDGQKVLELELQMVAGHCVGVGK